MLKISKILSIGMFLVSVNATTLGAFSLKENVQKTIKYNSEIKAELKNQEAYKKYVDEKEGGYLPTLDFSTYYEKNELRTSASNKRNEGWNAKLRFEQLLYNGGFTSSEIDELRASTKANKHRSHLNIETIILKSINVYLSLVQYEELMFLSKDIIAINETNLLTAKDKEEISGEILETYQVSSKLHFSQEKFLEQENEYNKNSDSFEKFLGIKNPKNLCRPLIKRKDIPNTLEKAIEVSIVNSDEIQEAISKITVQRAKLAQANSKFLPTLTFQLQSSWDDDLILGKNKGRQDEYLARLNLTWNLFNGLKDHNISQREEKFLLEAKKDLDTITSEIIMKTKSSYYKFHNNLKRVSILKSYVEDNENIVDVYKKEFDAGTRTFVDILNAESELYQANTSLVNREFSLFVDYYDLLFTMSSLSKSILLENNQVCSKKVKKVKKESSTDNVDDELLDLLDDEPEEEKTTPKIIDNFIENAVLSLPANNYIINLATISVKTDVNKFISKYNLNKKDITVFIFGKNNEFKKVLYGNYATSKEAKDAILKLNKSAHKNKPYINKISIHHKLYRKSH